jgi:hypothetical protein
MYLAAYEYVFPHYGWAVAATALFVVVSQLKINVTNAYAGSLAWSNFFSRLTHSHPGRVVWVVFNTLHRLHADGDERVPGAGRRAGAVLQHRHRLDDGGGGRPGHQQAAGPVARRASSSSARTCTTSTRWAWGRWRWRRCCPSAAHLGCSARWRRRSRRVIAMGTAFVAAPLIAWATAGATTWRHPRCPLTCLARGRGPSRRPAATSAAGAALRDLRARLRRPDMAHCPAYQGAICSLCCTLDARCGDLCKPHASLSVQWSARCAGCCRGACGPPGHGPGPLPAADAGHRAAAGQRVWPAVPPGAAFAVWSGPGERPARCWRRRMALRSGLLKAYMALLLIAGIVAWWLVLAHKSRQVAQEESNRQTEAC